MNLQPFDCSLWHGYIPHYKAFAKMRILNLLLINKY